MQNTFSGSTSSAPQRRYPDNPLRGVRSLEKGHSRRLLRSHCTECGRGLHVMRANKRDSLALVTCSLRNSHNTLQEPSAAALVAPPQWRLSRLPSYSPQLTLIERLGRVLRRRAPHTRLFASMPALRAALRASFCYFHTMRHKVLSPLHSPQKKRKQH